TLFDWSLDAIGLLNPAFDITESWQEPYRKGQIHYHQAGKVVGALLINTPGQIDSIRQIMI
ncbi:MAG: NAD(P)/FAD-dependent oxidoreductase, partial [Anaerolineae bacterium]|nr:NAD(P)/FAD-dependent oxidoreductase [Anaerolineae bacterium]